jgi:lysyl-tRNA synthetase class I
LVAHNAGKIVLAKIQDANSVTCLNEQKNALKKNIRKYEKTEDTKQKEIIKKKIDCNIEYIERFSRNGFTLKYHYLPEIDGVGGVINFHELVSLTKEEIEENFVKVASVTDKFRKDIIGRFSNLYSRQGQPVFTAGKIRELMLKS